MEVVKIGHNCNCERVKNAFNKMHLHFELSLFRYGLIRQSFPFNLINPSFVIFQPEIPKIIGKAYTYKSGLRYGKKRIVLIKVARRIGGIGLA